MKQKLRILMLLLMVLLKGSVSIGQTFTKVTDEADIVADGEYLIVNEAKSMAYSGVTNSYGSCVSVTISDNMISDPGTAHIVKLGGETGKWTIYDESDEIFLYYKGSGKNLFGTKEVSTSGTTWTITASSITNVNTSTRSLQYNISSPRFACYTSKQGDIVLYKKQDKTGKTTTTLTFGTDIDNKTFSLNIGDSFAAPTATLTPAEAGTITYASDNTDVATVDANGMVTLGETEGTAKITASFAGNDNYIGSSATYTIKLSKVQTVEDGVFDFTGTYDYGSGMQPSSNTAYSNDVTWTAGNVTLVTSGIRWWSKSGTNELRMYSSKGGKMTVSVPDGYLVRSILVNGVNGGFTADCGTFDSKTWTGASQNVTLTVTGTKAVTKNITGITVTYSKCETLTTAASGFATYASDYAVNYSDNGLEAYTVKVNDDKSGVVYTSFTGVVPAGKAVLIKGNASKEYVLAPATESAADFETDLKVSDGTVAVTADNHDNIYAFGTLNGESGFKHVKVGSTIPAKKGYLELADATGAKNFYAFDESTTGVSMNISNIVDSETLFFNLAGQRVAKDYKGIVIKNGKKYMNK